MAREFIMPRRIITGAGALEAAASELGRMGKKAMIVTGKVMVKIGNCAKVEEVLKGRGVDYTVYSEIIGEPTDIMIENGLKQYKAEGCDFLVAIGGGSPIDSMKAIGALVEKGGSICDFFGKTIEEQFAAWHKAAKARKKDCDQEVISLEELKEWLKNS